MASKTTKADIDFEQDLWKAADELRGAVAENQYKDYVLSLIFIKHLSERFDIRREELQHQLEYLNLCILQQIKTRLDLNELNNILAEIMEQAQGQYSDWPRMG